MHEDSEPFREAVHLGGDVRPLEKVLRELSDLLASSNRVMCNLQKPPLERCDLQRQRRKNIGCDSPNKKLSC